MSDGVAIEGGNDAGGPSPEELMILLDAASRLPPDKLDILLRAIWAAVGH